MDKSISNHMTIASNLVSFFESVDYTQYKNNSKKQAALVRSLLDIVGDYIKKHDEAKSSDAVSKHNTELELADDFRQAAVSEFEKFFKEGGNFSNGRLDGRELIDKVKNVLEYDPAYGEIRRRILLDNNKPTLLNAKTNDADNGGFAFTINNFLSDPVSIYRHSKETGKKDGAARNVDTSALDMFADENSPVQDKTVDSAHPFVFGNQGLPFELQKPLAPKQDDLLKLSAWDRLVNIYSYARLDARGMYAKFRERLQYIRKEKHIGIKQILQGINSSNVPHELGEDAILFYIKKNDLIKENTPKDSFNPSDPKKSEEDKEYEGDVRDNSLNFIPDPETMENIKEYIRLLNEYDNLTISDIEPNYKDLLAKAKTDQGAAKRIEDAWLDYSKVRDEKVKALKKITRAARKSAWLLRARMRILQDKLGIEIAELFCEAAKATTKRENDLADSTTTKELLMRGGVIYNKLKETSEYMEYANLFNLIFQLNRGGSVARGVNRERQLDNGPDNTVNNGFSTPHKSFYVVKRGEPRDPSSFVQGDSEDTAPVIEIDDPNNFLSDSDFEEIIKNYKKEPEKRDSKFVNMGPDLIDSNDPNYLKHHEILQKIITDVRYAKEFNKKNPGYVKYAVTSVGKNRVGDLNTRDIDKVANDFAQMSGRKDNPYGVDSVKYQDGFEKKDKQVAESILSFLDSL